MDILNKLKYFLHLNAKVLIYNPLILSHLTFCILACGYKCDGIIKLQKRIVRILSFGKYNAHTDPLFKTHTLLNFQNIFKLQEFKFYFKCINNNLPYYLQNLPFNRSTTHSHSTRAQYHIHQMEPNHEYARKCI